MKATSCLIILLLAGSNYCQAQKVTVGVGAGVSLASYKITAGNISATSSKKAGFTAGIMADIPAGNMFSFMPALNFVQKGGTVKSQDGKEKLTLNYLELPLNVVYNLKLTGDKLFIGAGPCLALGISGNDVTEFTGYPKEKTDIKFGSSADDDIKQFELSANIVAGYQLKNGLSIAINYNGSLNNLAVQPHTVDPVPTYKDHNRYFALRIGWMFRKK